MNITVKLTPSGMTETYSRLIWVISPSKLANNYKCSHFAKLLRLKFIIHAAPLRHSAIFSKLLKLKF